MHRFPFPFCPVCPSVSIDLHPIETWAQSFIGAATAYGESEASCPCVHVVFQSSNAMLLADGDSLFLSVFQTCFYPTNKPGGLEHAPPITRPLDCHHGLLGVN